MTMLPASSDFTGASITEGQFKTAITALRTFLYEKLGDDGSVAVQAFPAGTLMLFQQELAPTGWTKQTTHNDKALRVVSGTPSTGGSVAFSTVFGRSATDGHTLTTAEMPSHSHVQTGRQLGNAASFPTANALVGQAAYEGGVVGSADSTSAAGSGGSHSHNIDLRVQYVDLIIASKDA